MCVMTARETKPELAGLNLRGDFNAAQSGVLLDLVDAPMSEPAEMTNIFNLGARGAQDKAQMFVTTHTGERTSLSGIAAGSNSTLADKEKREKDEKRRLEDTLYRMLLDQLADAQRQMAEAAEVLHGKYGDDIVGGMAAAFLSDDQLATLQTDEERLAALADIFLDDDGNIKPEYADSPEAKYVQGWSKERQLKDEIKNIPNMSPSELESLKNEIAASTGMKAAKEGESIAQNQQVLEVAEKTVDSSACENATNAPADLSGLSFGK